MLGELHIKNFAVIEDARLNLKPGLTTISGEEGSGKSLVVDALSILLGARITNGFIRRGAATARVEGIFWLSSEVIRKLSYLLQETNIEIDSDGMLIISRELQQQGKSIARVNSRAVPLSLLRQIGQHLVDIHGQMEHISLLDVHHQLDILDIYGDLMELRHNFYNKIESLRQKTHQLSSLKINNANENFELIKYQVDEIERSDLKPGEDEELKKKHTLLFNAEALKENCLKAYNSLYGEERSVTVLIHDAILSLRSLKNIDSAIARYVSQLENIITEIEEAARSLRSHSESVESDTNLLSEIEERINLINTMKRKYGATIEDILSFYSITQAELSAFEHQEEQNARLEKDIEQIEHEAGKLAEELSLLRRSKANSLTELVNMELSDLGLPWAKFEIRLHREEDTKGLPTAMKKRFAFTDNGIDHVEYMIATNPGEPVRPLNKIASGGEICRIMLAIKSALKKVDPVPTLVFDEIDASVGGRSGDTMGRKLATLARQHQVICITHLPQIACFGDSHVRLIKDTTSGQANTVIEPINGHKRLEELAAMLGSVQAEKTMMNGANKLLREAQSWKEKELVSV